MESMSILINIDPMGVVIDAELTRSRMVNGLMMVEK
jgi:hypothetical protein